MIVVATICHPRKVYSLEQCNEAVRALTFPDKKLYLNYQRHYLDVAPRWAKERYDDVDSWQWDSTWHKGPKYDQDQARLDPIVMARNMCLAYARVNDASHILFVDSDVIVPPDSIEKLISVEWDIAGGVVNGRGVHNEAKYIFGLRYSATVKGVPVTVCNHGTMGFVLISSRAFNYVSFRTGYSTNFWASTGKSKPYGKGSEDPLFAEDVEFLGGAKKNGWLIRHDLVAQHIDDPSNPLTQEGVSPTYDVN